MLVNRSFLVELIFLVIAKMLLEYAYISFVNPMYAYAGFIYDFVFFKYALGWLVYLVGYCLLYMKRNIFINEIYLFMFLIYVLPNIIYYSFANQDTSSFLLLVIPFFVIIIATLEKKIFDIPDIPNGKVLILVLSLILVFSVILNYYVSTGGKMVFSFYEVYHFRTEFGVSSSSGIFGYLNSWASKIFVVILLSWSLYKKKLVFILFSIGLVLLLFVLSGHKSVLQSIFLVGFFYMIFKFYDTRLLIISGFIFLIAIAIILTHYFDLLMVGSLVIRRLLFVPAHLNFIYFDFFSQNEFVYWSNSVLKYFIDYPYDIRAVQVIGAYLGEPEMAANTGFIPSGYMHAGLLGILIYTLIAVIVFNLINMISQKQDKYFIMTISFIPINTLFTSSDLLTVFLTHGLLVLLFVLALYNKKEYSIEIKSMKYKI